MNESIRHEPYWYFHYWLCVIEAHREMALGWQKVRETTEMNRLWTTPGEYHESVISHILAAMGPYLRRAVVQRLGAGLGDDFLENDRMLLENPLGDDIDGEVAA